MEEESASQKEERRNTLEKMAGLIAEGERQRGKMDMDSPLNSNKWCMKRASLQMAVIPVSQIGS